MSPGYQLATYLVRYGILPGVKASTLLQMSEGSVYNHSKWFVLAFRKLKPLYVTWPSENERWALRMTGQALGFPTAYIKVQYIFDISGACFGSRCGQIQSYSQLDHAPAPPQPYASFPVLHLIAIRVLPGSDSMHEPVAYPLSDQHFDCPPVRDAVQTPMTTRF